MAAAPHDELFFLGRNKIYRGRAFWFLPVDQPFRRAVIQLVDTLWFERLILLIILVNVLLIAVSPSIGDSSEAVEVAFACVYTVEMLLRCIACGVAFSSATSYFRDRWNWLDFSVVVLGWLALIPGVPALVPLRAFRSLRGLRTVRHVSGMRILLETVTSSLPALLSVVAFLFSIVVVFVVIGVHLWAGRLYHYCDGVSDLLFCSADHGCPDDAVCVASTPNSGLTSFDHFGRGLAVVLRVISLDKWGNMMYYVMDSSSDAASVYFVLLALLSFVFVNNLIVTILFVTYDEMDDRALHRTRYQKAYFRIRKSVLDAEEVPNGRSLPALRAEAKWKASSYYNEESEASYVEDLEALQSAEELHESHWSYSTDYLFASSSDEDEPSPCEWATKRLAPCLAIYSIPEAQQRELYLASKPRAVLLLRRLVDHVAFSVLIGAVTAANVLTFGLLSFTRREADGDALGLANAVFLAVYGVELLLRLLAYGFVGFTGKLWHWIDVIAVVGGVAEAATGNPISWTCLKVFHLMRVFRVGAVVSVFPHGRRSVGTVGRSIKASVLLMLLLVLFTCVFALIGRDLFAGKLADRGRLPRSHFEDLYWSFISVWVIVSGKGWTDILYSCARWSTPWAVTFCVVVLSLGRYVALNLFVCAQLKKWDGLPSLPPAQQQPDNTIDVEPLPEDSDLPSFGALSDHRGAELQEESSVSEEGCDGVEDLSEERSVGDPSSHPSAVQRTLSRRGGGLRVTIRGGGRRADRDNNDEGEPASEHVPARKSTGSSFSSLRSRRRSSWSSVAGFLDAFASASASQYTVAEVPIHLLTTKPEATNPLQRFVFSTLFEWAVDAIIIIATVFLFATASEFRSEAAHVTDLVFTSLMAVEVLARVAAYGRTAALDSFILLDVTCLAMSLLSLPYSAHNPLRLLRGVRGLRLLRVFARLKGAQVLFFSLRLTIPRLVVPLCALAVTWLAFALAMLQKFVGSFHACSNPEFVTRKMCTSVVNNATWVPTQVTFDNFGNALTTSYTVIARTDWRDVLYQLASSVGNAEAPRPEARPAHALWAVAFFLVVVCFVLPLFVSVVVDSFTEAARTLDRSVLGANAEKSHRLLAYLLMATASSGVKYPEPKYLARVRLPFYRVTTHRWWEPGIAVVIFLNAVVLCTWHADQSRSWERTLVVFEIVFITIYTIEFAVKLVALGPSYFSSPWNVLDCLVLLVAYISLVVESMSHGSSAVTVVRVVRLIRLLRLISRSSKLYILLRAVLIAFPPAAIALGVMLTLLACTAVCLVPFMEASAVESAGSASPSFSSWSESFLSLIRLVTSDVWSSLLPAGASSRLDSCSSTEDGECVPHARRGALISLHVMFAVIFQSIFLAITFEPFAEALRHSKLSEGVAAMQRFRELWKERDPFHDGFVSLDEFAEILYALPDDYQIDLSSDTSIQLLVRQPVPITDDHRVPFLPAFSHIGQIAIGAHGQLHHVLPPEEEWTKRATLPTLMRLAIFEWTPPPT